MSVRRICVRTSRMDGTQTASPASLAQDQTSIVSPIPIRLIVSRQIGWLTETALAPCDAGPEHRPARCIQEP